MSSTNHQLTIVRFPRERTELLPILLAVQEAEGYISESSLRAIALHTYVPESEVYGIATSYSELRLSAPDPRSVTICTGMCRSCGSCLSRS